MDLERRRPLLFYGALLFFLVGLGFHNVLDNGFTYDDRSIVVENLLIRQVDLGQIFSTNYWYGYQGHDAGLYRPLVILSYALTHSLVGLDPFYYHLTNLILHLGCSLLVLALGQRLLGSGRAAGLAALLFALHPVHTEVVANVAGRKELLAALLFFAAWWAYGHRRQVWPWGAALLFLGALLTKEDTVVLLAVLVAVDGWRADDWRAVARRCWRRWAVMVTPLVVYMGVRLWVLGLGGAATTTSLAVENPLAGAGWLERLLSVVRVFGRYFELLLWPLDLKADYSLDQFPLVQTAWDGAWILSLAAVAASLVLAWYGRRGAAGFCVVFFYLTLAIVCNLFFTIGTPLAERFLYVPSAAFCWLGGLALYRLGATDVRAMVVAAVLAVGAYGALSQARNPVWKDNATFFARNVETSPRSARARYHWGMEHYQAGRTPQAVAEFDHAVSIAPDHANALYMSGLVKLDLEQWDAAGDVFQRALEAARRLGLPDEYRQEVEVRLLLAQGGGLLAMGQEERARALFAEASSMGPAEDLARVGLARAHLARGDTAALRRALARVGPAGEARTLRADLMRLAGKADQARGQYRQAVDELMARRRWAAAGRAVQRLLAYDSGDRGALLRQARITAFKGNLAEAVSQVEAVVLGQPRWALPHRYLGEWLAVSGRKEEARRAYEQYVRLERDPRRRTAAEAALQDLGN